MIPSAAEVYATQENSRTASHTHCSHWLRRGHLLRLECFVQVKLRVCRAPFVAASDRVRSVRGDRWVSGVGFNLTITSPFGVHQATLLWDDDDEAFDPSQDAAAEELQQHAASHFFPKKRSFASRTLHTVQGSSLDDPDTLPQHASIHVLALCLFCCRTHSRLSAAVVDGHLGLRHPRDDGCVPRQVRRAPGSGPFHVVHCTQAGVYRDVCGACGQEFGDKTALLGVAAFIPSPEVTGRLPSSFPACYSSRVCLFTARHARHVEYPRAALLLERHIAVSIRHRASRSRGAVGPQHTGYFAHLPAIHRVAIHADERCHSRQHGHARILHHGPHPRSSLAAVVVHVRRRRQAPGRRRR
jgi:hypothetical protein